MFQSDTWPETYRKCLKIFLNKWSHWVSSSQAEERTMHNLEMDPLPLSCACFSIQREGFGKPCSVWRLSHTHFIFSFHLGLSVATQQREQLFLWFPSGSAHRADAPEVLREILLCWDFLHDSAHKGSSNDSADTVIGTWRWFSQNTSIWEPLLFTHSSLFHPTYFLHDIIWIYFLMNSH